MRAAIAFPLCILIGAGGALAFFYLCKWIQENGSTDWEFMLLLAAFSSIVGLFVDRIRNVDRKANKEPT